MAIFTCVQSRHLIPYRRKIMYALIYFNIAAILLINGTIIVFLILFSSTLSDRSTYYNVKKYDKPNNDKKNPYLFVDNYQLNQIWTTKEELIDKTVSVNLYLIYIYIGIIGAFMLAPILTMITVILKLQCVLILFILIYGFVIAIYVYIVLTVFYNVGLIVASNLITPIFNNFSINQCYICGGNLNRSISVSDGIAAIGYELECCAAQQKDTDSWMIKPNVFLLSYTCCLSTLGIQNNVSCSLNDLFQPCVPVMNDKLSNVSAIVRHNDFLLGGFGISIISGIFVLAVILVQSILFCLRMNMLESYK